MGTAYKRDLRLDLVRGMALVCLCIDHIPCNFFSAFTLRNYTLSDAAEVFVMISGITAALGFGEILRRQGKRAWLQRIGRRILQLYVAQLSLILAAALVLGAGMSLTGKPASWADTPLAAIVGGGWSAWRDVIGVRLQPELIDILPLYMVLLAALPIIHLVARRSAVTMLALSGAVWLMANELNSTAGGTWYFNPYAWQFLFTIGVVFGIGLREGHEMPRRRWLAALAIAYCMFGFLMAAPWTMIPAYAEVRVMVPEWMGPVAKTNLSAWRITSILAIAYLWSYFVPAGSAWLRSRFMEPVILLGRNSLSVLVAATIVDYMAIAARLGGARGIVYQLGFNAAGLAAIWLTAWAVEAWYARAQSIAVRVVRPAATELSPV